MSGAMPTPLSRTATNAHGAPSTSERPASISMSPAVAAVLDRVADEVGDDLREPDRSPSTATGVSGSRTARCWPRASAMGPAASRARVTTSPSDRRSKRSAMRAARDARHVEQVVDQPRQVLDLARGDVARRGLARLVGAGELRRTAPRCDRGERVAQLVRERGEELVLAPVGLAQRALRRAGARRSPPRAPSSPPRARGWRARASG